MKELDQLVENFFQPKRDTLGLDQLVEMVEHTILEMASKRGVAHPDKMGKELTDQDGNKLQLTKFEFFTVGKDAIDSHEELIDNVALVTKESDILYRHPQEPNKGYNSAIIVFAEADGKKYSFIKYTRGSSLWREVDFAKATGFRLKDTQSAKEIISLGPSVLIDSEQMISLDSLPDYVFGKAKASSDIPETFANSLPEFFKTVYEKSNPSPLEFDSSDQRNRSFSSVNKYFGEIMAPVLLGTNYMVEPSSILADAQDNLLKPFGLTWADSTGVSYPLAPQNPLVDSYIHFEDKKIGVSSKSARGANPSIKNLHTMIYEEANEQQRLQLSNAGFGDYIEMINDLVEHSAKLGPIEVAVKFGILSEEEGKEAAKAIKDNISIEKVNLSDELDAITAYHSPVRGVTLSVNKMKDINETYKSKIVRTYTPANHIAAGIAKAVASKINEQTMKNGERKFTSFGKAVYSFSNMVQVYGNFSKSGESQVEMKEFRVVYPPNFAGEMYLDAGKGYTSSGQNDKLTVKLK